MRHLEDGDVVLDPDGRVSRETIKRWDRETAEWNELVLFCMRHGWSHGESCKVAKVSLPVYEHTLDHDSMEVTREIVYIEPDPEFWLLPL